MIFESIDNFLIYSISTSKLLSKNCKKTFINYYSKFYNSFDNYDAKIYKEQTLEITNVIKKLKSPKILEVGSGCGTESLWFALLGGEVTGIDLNINRLKVAEERKKLIEKKFNKLLKVNFQNINFFDYCKFNKGNRFDIIWMEQAYHHIEPRKELLVSVKNLLKENGLLIISESNAYNPLLQLKLFIKRGFKTIIYTKNGRAQMYGNERITTRSALIFDLKKNEFEILNTKLFRIFPNNFLKPLHVFEKFISKKLFFFLFLHFNIVAKIK
tara:strand:- start:124 stop:933 length:810 start_codon:yes stop_codon:yes gene_type:complete